MLQNLQNFAKFQKCQLDNLVDFEKCCKTRIFLQKSVPIQPKTSEILPKMWPKTATSLRVRPFPLRPERDGPGPRQVQVQEGAARVAEDRRRRVAAHHDLPG